MFLRISSFLLHLVLIIYFGNKQLQLYNYYDEITCSLPDYSILLSNIPKEKYPRQKLKQMLKNDLKVQDGAIQEVILIPDPSEVDEIEHDRKKC